MLFVFFYVLTPTQIGQAEKCATDAALQILTYIRK